ncbi:MAG: hypothetical protein AVDCRST_MAG90-2772 [uncultured Microvirga sp.]|uniref:DAGKc domain-containing protein n=1 Tax=uncultured Microvirga sp. TaxID=412392 RepID=A0A6J4MF67_9HYPH|nr:MAG: hypothetical protein AVDCRST_MAG90-2772 [uncultured Microvirga sp.]
MKPIVLVNASAGTVLQFDGEDLPGRIGSLFAEGGVSAEVRRVEARSLMAELERAKRADQPVVIAGGDGSVSAAIQVFAGTGTPLGVLPFGTYNLLGRDLGMSTEYAEAVRQLASGRERLIDLGKVGRRYFHTLSGLGFFSRVARQRAEVRKSVSSKVIGAAVAAVRSFTRGGSLDVVIDGGRGPEEFRTPAILITNNLMEGETWRRPRLDAGVFEVNVVRGDIPFSLLRGGLAAMTGSWRESGDIATWSTPALTLSFRRPRVFLSLDGEVKRPRTPLRFEIVPKALTVLAPAAAAQQGDFTAEKAGA